MRDWKGTIAKAPVVGRIALTAYRAAMARRYLAAQIGYFGRWLITSRETTNFTYDLEPSNRRYLAAAIAEITGTPFEDVVGYFEEIEGDDALREHVLQSTAASDYAFMADDQVRFGRRIGWYALVRVLKPRNVIETGVDKGLGACVLTSALKRNRAEGHSGHYYGTDINPKAGYLLSGDYANYGTILYGDSIKSLSGFAEPIDLFINDSDHSADYEADEYRTIIEKLSRNAMILGDNAHATDKLLEFSLATKRNFVFFQEKPAEHWYPGGGIGFSFTR